MEFKIIAGVLGGLALFIYGMNLMGNGLQKVAGDGLKRLIEVLTKNKYLGVLVGTIVTMLIQSSSATTVMVVGFVNASLMNLNQAIGVIMGANIGTTITAQLVAFKLTDIAPLIVALGVFLHLISKKRKHSDVAEVLIGFGILFIGMQTMSSVMRPLASEPFFAEMLMGLENPVIGIIAGILITLVVQSSSATIGLLIAVASTGALSLTLAFPILFGDNIGTCVTALLSSIGANRTAKRAALMHLLFNIFGTIIFMVLLYTTPLISLIQNLSSGDIARQIANAHTIFNVTNTLIMLPFAGFFVYAVEKLIPIKDYEKEFKPVKHLDSRIIEEMPSIAIGLGINEVVDMGKIVRENLRISKEAFINKNINLMKEVHEKETIIDRLAHEITAHLIELSNQELSDSQKLKITSLISNVTSLERIGDLAEDIVEHAENVVEEGIEFTENAIEELNFMFDAVSKSLEMALEAFEKEDEVLIERVTFLEDEVDNMEKTFRKQHIQRLNARECTPKASIVFLDVIGYLERISDHAVKIATGLEEEEFDA
ncbi:Na/Pi-cotransporter II-related protein [Methanococcus vannielii SB]|uniref:Na/Pi-cotransporter II-related protein n=1 Tax=Methanococcus vannielii (strain ATCC 35089 / DSM 1224 / JCM 13029 / OCM 148 / SB) TaxID=406327 RepID=A6USE7_METVS|nr:Na/Pi cotransporter family protein [Methanococcus vannielii]ABR55419.1 Na/Pi-cotransporter II-related protein [Methanococcus vannielii SB]